MGEGVHKTDPEIVSCRVVATVKGAMDGTIILISMLKLIAKLVQLAHMEQQEDMAQLATLARMAHLATLARMVQWATLARMAPLATLVHMVQWAILAQLEKLAELEFVGDDKRHLVFSDTILPGTQIIQTTNVD